MIALRRLTSYHSLSAAFLIASILPGCASPGAPVTRESQKPLPVTDLSATQVSNSIVLSFTLPKQTVHGGVIAETPALQIYRAFENVPSSSGGAEKPRLVVTIPSQMMTRYEHDSRIVFPDILTPDDLAAHNGMEAVYEVRTRIGRSSSAPSNPFRIRILAAPPPIRDLRAQIMNNAIELDWSAPQIVTASSEQPSIEYEVYREVSGTGAQQSEKQENAGQRGAEKSAEFKLLGQTSQPSYKDQAVESGRIYSYVVRSTAKYVSGSVESQDSNRVEIAFAPISQPAAPERLVGTVIPGNGPALPTVELSWAIGPETNIAGYNVYRSDTESSPGTRVNTSLVLVPVFRDSSVASGQRYFYRVTAVNRAGDESEPSATVEVTLPESK